MLSELNKWFVFTVQNTGHFVIDSFDELGRFVFFIKDAFREALRPPFRWREILIQMEFIGNQSLGIILMSAFAIGSVFALQVGMVFKTFSAEGQMGIATAKALTRELAPMMTAFLITGRAGAAMTAEIATMKVNEQVEALESMGVSPIHYLVVPRIFAALVMMPLLSGIFVFVGIIGSFVVGTLIFDVDQGVFFSKITAELVPRDLTTGLEKAFIFSFVIVLVACRFGLKTKGGAKGVGQGTTDSVIVTLLVLLLVDFVYTFFQVYV